MKIDNSIKTTATNPVEGTPPKTGGAGKQQRDTGQPKDSVQISPLSSQLHSIETAMASTGVVDTAKVEKIKQAISDGKFQVHPEVIADRLLETVNNLLRTQHAH